LLEGFNKLVKAGGLKMGKLMTQPPEFALDILPDSKRYKKIFTIPSSSSNKKRKISFDMAIRNWVCDCPGQLRHGHCHHLESMDLKCRSEGPDNETYEAILRGDSMATKYAKDDPRNPWTGAPSGTYEGPRGNPAIWAKAFAERLSEEDAKNILRGQSPWEILGLFDSEDMSLTLARDAFKTLIKVYHPDISKTGDAEKAKKLIAAISKIEEILAGRKRKPKAKAALPLPAVAVAAPPATSTATTDEPEVDLADMLANLKAQA
jgi:hypothetical protein